MMQCEVSLPGPSLILCSTVPTLSLNTWGMFLERKNVPQVLVGRVRYACISEQWRETIEERKLECET